MPEEKLGATESDSNQDELDALFLGETALDSFSPYVIDNEYELDDLFGLGNNSTSKPPDPDPPGTEGLEEVTKRAKDNAEAASEKAKQALQAARAAATEAQKAKNESLETLNTTSSLKHQVEAAKQAAETTSKKAQQASQVIGVTATEAQTALTTTREVNSEAQTALTVTQEAKNEAYKAKNEAQATLDTTKILKHQVEAAKQAAETARQSAEKAKEHVESIYQTLGVPPSPPRNHLVDFFKKHLLTLLFGSIALISLLLLLNKILNDKPAMSVYVNPITGKDTNNGSSDAPFRTLSHALQKVGAGSHIYLAKGDYSNDRSLTIPTNTKLIIQSQGIALNDINGHWATSFISALAAQGLVVGDGDGSFKPDDTLTRAQYAALLVKAFSLPPAGSVKKFNDVDTDYWAYDAIQRTYNQGFLKGPTEDDFKPNDTVKRVEVIVTLVNGLRFPLSQGLPSGLYQDQGSVPSWAERQVATAITDRLIVIDPNNPQTLAPTRNATRAETVVMLYQALVKQGKMPAIEAPYLVKQ